MARKRPYPLPPFSLARYNATMTTDFAMPSNAEQAEQLRWKKFPVLDDGFVCLVDVMGDDRAVVEAARVSYGEGTRAVSDDRTLIRYLMRHQHTTPFEMVELKFLVRVPMDCWRQWIRHRTASVNETSTRYSMAIDAAQQTAAGRMAQAGPVEPPGQRGPPARPRRARSLPPRKPPCSSRPAPSISERLDRASRASRPARTCRFPPIRRPIGNGPA